MVDVFYLMLWMVSTKKSTGEYILPEDRIQRAGDVVFMVIHCLFPQSYLHVGVTLKDRTKCSLTFNYLPLKK